MYVAGLVIPVAEERWQDYRAWAERGAAILRDYGCVEIVEAWEDNVPDGSLTDFRRAVAARPGERIVFAWQIWPDRATLDAAEARIATDPRAEARPPFDGHRLIIGGFAPLFTMGRQTPAV